MWSGPRNLSTAMMYSFAARPDFAVWDEPFYAPYLTVAGIDHPMRDEILEAHDTDPERVAERCLGPIPEAKPNLYMKHMPHHMLPEFPLDWARDCVNVHLIRHPARVIGSYVQKRNEVTLEDIGFEQQVSVFNRVGGIVIDSEDIRRDPECALSALCSEIGLPFDHAMLSWPTGGHSSDGVWSRHWYGAVHESAGFAGPEGTLPKLDHSSQSLCERALPAYEHLKSHALKLPKVED